MWRSLERKKKRMHFGHSNGVSAIKIVVDMIYRVGYTDSETTDIPRKSIDPSGSWGQGVELNGAYGFG